MINDLGLIWPEVQLICHACHVDPCSTSTVVKCCKGDYFGHCSSYRTLQDPVSSSIPFQLTSACLIEVLQLRGKAAMHANDLPVSSTAGSDEKTIGRARAVVKQNQAEVRSQDFKETSANISLLHVLLLWHRKLLANSSKGGTHLPER